ncbi:sigma-54 interaction domain-containing protein [Oceanobacillus damuensis]|uniref:sigma-54 interaction domain-containing protein n=1 Tax=Oceanobacillus damuensis TaxID=937928 RepID=UPI00082FBBD9|nr:sigma 54-interacting transcriptional regulator [Oceanobacillus damuensis]
MLNHLFYLEAVLAAEDDAITIVNSKMEVIFWNDAAVQTYNIKLADIIHKPINAFFHNDDLMVLKVLETKEPVKNAYHRPRKDKHVVVNAVPIFDETDQLIGALSVERDISQIVKLNDNLETTSAELHELRQKVYTNMEETPFSKLTGKSLPLQQTINIARKAAKTDATTLILGESGTGKEICARAIHEASDRNSGPFIPVNCGAIPEALFESELFGYEGGSFTGAEKKGKAGKIEMADGGTIFLDEVGELPLEMQVKLLRVLQENSIYRIGDSKGRQVNVRFIAATNQNLEQLMEEKKFRSDLYYRLNVIQVTMPPLRDRMDDIHELAEMFLKHFASHYQVPIPVMEKDAIHLLLQYNWPGNIRELRNLMERIIILTEKSQITKQDLLGYLPSLSPNDTSQQTKKNNVLPQEKENIEKQLIEKTLNQTNGNKSETAKRLGISRVTLYTKMKKYGIVNL